MFHKEGSSAGGNSNKKKRADVPLGKKDKKQLRKRVQAYFDNVLQLDGEADKDALRSILDACFLQATNLSARCILLDRKACKMMLYLRAPSDDASWPYQRTSQFVWMAMEEKSKLLQETPTVALWSAVLASLPSVVPIANYAVTVPCPVSKFVCRGADLMKAGMRSAPQAASATSASRGTLAMPTILPIVPICVQNNPIPFAVGELQNVQEFGPETKGIGVKIWHAYGDDLWQQHQSAAAAGMPVKGMPSKETGVINPIGGSHFDDGNYGNVGFVDGKMVYPLQRQEGDSDAEEDKAIQEKSESGVQDQGQSDPSTKVWDDVEGGADSAVSAADEPSTQAPPPPTTTTTTQAESMANTETAEEGTQTTETTATTATTAATTETDAEEEQDEAPAATPEEVLHATVCQALVALKKSDLPMIISTFYSQHVLPNRPEGTTIQLKATKYKKFGTYLKEQVARGLLKVGPDKGKKDPMGMLLSVERRHQDLRGFSKSGAVESMSAASNKNNNNNNNKMLVVNLFVVPQHWTALLRLDPNDVRAANATSEERKGTGMLTTSEARKMLEAYIAREELVDPIQPEQIVLDGPLTDALFKLNKKQRQSTPQHYPETILRKDAAKLWTSKCGRAYALVAMPGSKILHLAKGTPPKIEIEVTRRQSRKFVTYVRGLEEYHIDAHLFSKDVAKRFACSASADADLVGRAALKKDRVELLFQGNLVEELTALLTGDEKASSHGGVKDSPYNLPKGVIQTTLRKGVPGRSNK